jgi:uncharacterized protein (DUF2062 family)
LTNAINKLRKSLIHSIRKLLSLRASPHQIALGFAIGVFIGIFPTFGLGGLVIISLAALSSFNIPAALLGTVIGNPLFASVWITLTCLLTGISPGEIKLPKETFHEILVHYSQIGLRYLIGNFGISLIVAIASYFILIRAVHWFRGRKNYAA